MGPKDREKTKEGEQVLEKSVEELADMLEELAIKMGRPDVVKRIRRAVPSKGNDDDIQKPPTA